MLVSLLIENYALIDSVAMEPDPHLNIITGETGAGKSIMLGAIGLLLGERADGRALFAEAKKCVVEGKFHLRTQAHAGWFDRHDFEFEADCIIRREIAPSGKSRAFVNDSPVTLEVLRELSENLLDIHSQNDTAKLSNASYQLGLLDSFGGHSAQAIAFTSAYKTYKSLEQELNQLKSRLSSQEAAKEYNDFLLAELEKAELREGEMTLLEQQSATAAHAEKIAEASGLAINSLSAEETGTLRMVEVSASALEKVSNYAPVLGELATRLKSVGIELNDIVAELTTALEEMGSERQDEDTINTRLFALQALLKKHGAATDKDLIAKRNALAEQAEGNDQLREAIERAERKLAKEWKDLNQHAQGLSKARALAAKQLELEINQLLPEVGLLVAKFQVGLEPVTLNNLGADSSKFLFSANKGVALQDIKVAASGGEFSRLMLCLKYALAGKAELPTIIFDEIDTGISGEIAKKVGTLMARMAQRHQLFVITHMPQMAARATQHYYVYKDAAGQSTKTNVRLLNEQERLQEVAQMIGGLNPSATAMASAKELMESH